MVKDRFKEKEAIAYLSLENDLKNDHLAHSYLLCGELNPLKKEVAFLLAQSIIENKKDYACEECVTCQRIKEGRYFDVIYLDGHKESIKKEHIEYIMEQFSRTSLEKANKKVYIIDNINNASPKVLNMILKFMEEPSGKDTYGIFISDDLDSLLPTVVSRCQKITFMTRDFSGLLNNYEEAGYQGSEAYMLSQIRHEYNEDNELFLIARDFVYKTIESLDDKAFIPVLFSREFYSCVNKDKFKELSDYYLDIMILMLSDGLNGALLYEDYDHYLELLRKDDIAFLLDVFLKAREKAQSMITRTLLFDQIAYRILSYS